MKKNLIITLVIVILVIIAFVFWKKPSVAPTIAPNPEVTQQNSISDLISVSEPRPNSNVRTTFNVTGQARGSWYFEASFPIILKDNKGNILVQTIAKAQGDWMTDNFVPFSSTVSITSAYTGPAILILKNDNPSGDPTKDKQIEIPITISK